MLAVAGVACLAERCVHPDHLSRQEVFEHETLSPGVVRLTSARRPSRRDNPPLLAVNDEALGEIVRHIGCAMNQCLIREGEVRLSHGSGTDYRAPTKPFLRLGSRCARPLSREAVGLGRIRFIYGD